MPNNTNHQNQNYETNSTDRHSNDSNNLCYNSNNHQPHMNSSTQQQRCCHRDELLELRIRTLENHICMSTALNLHISMQSRLANPTNGHIPQPPPYHGHAFHPYNNIHMNPQFATNLQFGQIALNGMPHFVPHVPNQPQYLPHLPNQPQYVPHLPNQPQYVPHLPNQPQYVPHLPNQPSIYQQFGSTPYNTHAQPPGQFINRQHGPTHNLNHRYHPHQPTLHNQFNVQNNIRTQQRPIVQNQQATNIQHSVLIEEQGHRLQRNDIDSALSSEEPVECESTTPKTGSSSDTTQYEKDDKEAILETPNKKQLKNSPVKQRQTPVNTHNDRSLKFTTVSSQNENTDITVASAKDSHFHLNSLKHQPPDIQSLNSEMMESGKRRSI